MCLLKILERKVNLSGVEVNLSSNNNIQMKK